MKCFDSIVSNRWFRYLPLHSALTHFLYPNHNQYLSYIIFFQAISPGNFCSSHFLLFSFIFPTFLLICIRSNALITICFHPIFHSGPNQLSYLSFSNLSQLFYCSLFLYFYFFALSILKPRLRLGAFVHLNFLLFYSII